MITCNGSAPSGLGTLWEQEVRTAQAGQFLLMELLKTNQDVTRYQCLGGNHGHGYHEASRELPFG